MGRPGADAQVVVGLDDAVEAGDVAQVDEQARLRQAELDEREEAVAAGQELRLAFAILEDPQRLVQVRRTDVVELGGNHRAATLLPARAGAIGRPVLRGTGIGVWRRSRAGVGTWRLGFDRRSGLAGMLRLSIAPVRSHVNVIERGPSLIGPYAGKGRGGCDGTICRDVRGASAQTRRGRARRAVGSERVGFEHAHRACLTPGGAIGARSHRRLGVEPIVNGRSTFTILGGSLMPPQVLEAMREAAACFVDLTELQVAVGRRLAALTRNEAAFVSGGAAAGLFLSAAACMARRTDDGVLRPAEPRPIPAGVRHPQGAPSPI